MKKNLTTIELRLGNYVYGQSELETTGEMINHLCIVRCLDNIDAAEYPIMVESESNREWFDGFVGIELTEDILLKLGFVFEPYNKVFRHCTKERLYVDINNQIAKHFGNANGILVMIDYVHQLQNIYYALTNNELLLTALDELKKSE